MYDLNVKSKFIHFRAKGLTIKKISELMGINRTTLIQWNKELYTDIKIAERDEYEQIFESCFCDKSFRVLLLAEELGECYKKLANKEERADNMILLKEIEKLTKLINMETDDKKYYSMLQKSEKTVNKKFPVIINDRDKFREYDETYMHDDDEPLDLEYAPKTTYTKEQEEKMRKLEEKEEAEMEELKEEIRAEAEELLIQEAKENSVVTSKADMKRSKRVINRKPDLLNSKLRMQNSKLKTRPKSDQSKKEKL